MSALDSSFSWLTNVVIWDFKAVKGPARAVVAESPGLHSTLPRALLDGWEADYTVPAISAMSDIDLACVAMVGFNLSGRKRIKCPQQLVRHRRSCQRLEAT
jgi:hypothetical protein